MKPKDCPLCHRYYCDHTPEERGQTWEEIDEGLRFRAAQLDGENRERLQRTGSEKVMLCKFPSGTFGFMEADGTAYELLDGLRVPRPEFNGKGVAL